MLSTEPHAVIERLETAEALELPGVVAVVTAADLPVAGDGAGRSHEPLARSEVVYAGQPVAVVVAESEAAATDAAELVAVHYAPLEPVLDLEAAMEPGAPLARRPPEGDAGSDLASVHATVSASAEGTDEEPLSGNVLKRALRGDGDLESAFAESDAVVSATFRTPWVYQAYLEPQTATAWLEPGGVLAVSTSTQATFQTRSDLAKLFGLPLDRVRVRGAPIGGGFGGKVVLIEPLAAGAALAVGRPVRLTLTRSEDFLATNPAPAEILHVRAGATRDGDLRALEVRIVCDRGATIEWGIEDITSILAAGPYRWGAFAIRAYGVQTNRMSLGAYRAPGGPPAGFAIESVIDELAAELGLDPVELRLRNVVAPGDVGVSGRTFASIGARECLERIREHPIWQERASLPDGEGAGLALGYWPGAIEPASAACRLDADGKLTVVTATVDMTGTDTTFAAIAAEVLGLPPDSVRVVSADTSSAPYAGASGGSKVTYNIGRAVQRAAEATRERLLQVASEELEIAPSDLEIEDGVVRAVGAPDRSRTVEELARRALAFGGRYEPIEGHGGSAHRSSAPAAAAHLAHVRVDRSTGEIEVLRYAIAQDVGRALNPALVEGQLRGGVAQAIGWALYEEIRHDADGRPLTTSFLDYALPTTERVPPIDTLLVEVPSPDGPFGARGVGEAPVVAGPAAVANAVAAASGTRLRELPMTAPRVWAALQDTGSPAVD